MYQLGDGSQGTGRDVLAQEGYGSGTMVAGEGSSTVFPDVVPGGAVRLHSVDIFDTVLVRAVGDPTAVFLLLGRIQAAAGLTGLTAEVFARARRDAEDRARSHHGEATSLDHILGELSWARALEPERVAELRARELELEARLLRPVPHASEWLDRLRAQARVAFVSDTYYPSGFLRDQLRRHGLWDDRDALYASWEIGREKRTSRLFPALARREGARRRQIVHYGNDPVADVAGPRRARVRAQPVTAANLNRYEQILETFSFATGGMSSLFAGASRSARLGDVPGTDDGPGIQRSAAGVMAPTLVAYVLHILRDAARRGLERLYFVARDGEVLLEVAEGLTGRVGGPADLRYLYGSRQAWNLPAVTRVEDDHLEWILFATDLRSVRSVLARVRLEPEEIGAALGGAGFPATTWSEHLSPAQAQSLGAVLKRAPAADLILAKAAAQRSLLSEYLDQEGLTEHIPYGVVDIGWRGRMGANLSTVLHAAGAAGPSVFYFFGLQGSPPAGMTADADAYFFDDGRAVGAAYQAIPGLTYLMETFCSGSHGLVTGYERTDARVRPLLKDASAEVARRWVLPAMRVTLARFVESVALDGDIAELDADLRPAINALLEALASRPDPDEARAWGAFPFKDDQTEAFTRRLAYPYEPKEVVTALLLSRERHRTYRYWPGASRRLSHPVLEVLMGRPLEYSGRARRKASRLAHDWAQLRRHGPAAIAGDGETPAGNGSPILRLVRDGNRGTLTPSAVPKPGPGDESRET